MVYLFPIDLTFITILQKQLHHRDNSLALYITNWSFLKSCLFRMFRRESYFHTAFCKSLLHFVIDNALKYICEGRRLQLSFFKERITTLWWWISSQLIDTAGTKTSNAKVIWVIKTWNFLLSIRESMPFKIILRPCQY